MRILTAILALVVVIAFNNCGSGGNLTVERGASSSSLATPDPQAGLPPQPAQPYAIQPDATNSMADVKPLANGICPNGYGLYDMLNTMPAIDGTNWVHSVCVKPFSMGTTSVISDAQFVTGASCAADSELVATLPLNNDSTQQRWAMSYSICIKRQTLPVTASFVTYFYFSAPGAACRTGDVVSGTGMFCTSPNNGGQCAGPVMVNFCKSVQ